MKIYTLEGFRKNLREAFNTAEQGGVVTITRYGKTFVLLKSAPNDEDK